MQVSKTQTTRPQPASSTTSGCIGLSRDAGRSLPPGGRLCRKTPNHKRNVRPRKTAATSSSTPSRTKRIEPAPLGPYAARMGSLRHPPSGPYVPASGGVLPAVPDEARRLPDRGAEGALRHSRLREQVPLVRPERTCPRRGGQQP